MVPPGAGGFQRRRARRRRAVAAVAGVLLLAVIFAGATIAVLSWQGGEQQRAANAGEPVASEPAIAAATVTASDGRTDGGRVLDIPQNTGAPGELTMKLEFTDTVWVRVLVDGRNELEGIMRPGAVTQFTGTDEIQVRIGVAEAVEFSLNGAWYGNIASSHDRPVNVTCTAEGGCEVTRVG